MTEFVFKLPDLGEGTVEAEIVEWHVQPGDRVSEGDIVADVMTDKANVEVPAPVSGRVLRVTGEPGDVIPVGAELIAFDTAPAGAGAAPEPVVTEAERPPERARAGKSAPVAEPQPSEGAASPTERAQGASREPHPEPATATAAKVITSPAIRRRAKEAGVDLTQVTGTGPRGRILRSDLEAYLEAGDHVPSERILSGAHASDAIDAIDAVKVIGIRRVIAERTSASKREIPHFAYVEEIDVTDLDTLRGSLNHAVSDENRLTLLPLIVLAVIRALPDFPQCNAHFDPDTGTLNQHRRVHLGVATQTPHGLKVPVVRSADQRTLWDLNAELKRVTSAARDNTAGRAELTGSTITVTSLGRLGGIVTTPVINAPETAIIGVNKAVKRPVVVDDQVRVRLIMNLSSSFDHRFVDGFDAASLVQRIKGLLEQPALLFVDMPTS